MIDAGPPALALDGVSRRFGGVVAVDGVSLTLGAGERVSVIGPNGAGKTTLFRLIAGEMRPSGGRINLLGRDVTRMPAHHRAGLGLARTFQVSNLFVGLTVLENVRLASQTRGRDRWRFWGRMSADDGPGRAAREALEHAGLQGRARDRVADLSHGEQRQLEVAMALVSEPRLLLLDEPAAGLAIAERGQLRKLLEDLPRTLPVLLIEHDMSLALGLADRVCACTTGRSSHRGPPTTFGATRPFRRSTSAGPWAVLEVVDLEAGYASARVLNGISLSVGEGEVLALLGRNGMGKTTLLRSICGLRPPVATAGSIRFRGSDVRTLAAHEVARAGISIVPQGRRVFASLTVEENLRIARQQRGRSEWDLGSVYELFPRLRERSGQRAGTLSGGEQQMLAIGRSLMANPAPDHHGRAVGRAVADGASARSASGSATSAGAATACCSPNRTWTSHCRSRIGSRSSVTAACCRGPANPRRSARTRRSSPSSSAS